MNHSAHPASESRPAVLHRLLDASLQFAPEYGQGLASHLPMALGALHELGADPAQMSSFHGRYAARLGRAGAAGCGRGPISGWKSLRGCIDSFVVLRRHFDAMLVRNGRDAVLRDALPALMDGAAGAAFHGPIRIAHAVESNHAGELAAALAYGAARWTPLPEPGRADAVFIDPAEWLDALCAHQRRSAPGWRSSAPLISDRMQDAARTRAWVALADALVPMEDDAVALLALLSKASARRFADTGNFTVLHMATASRAARVLAPWMPVHERTWTPWLRAVAAASIASCAVASPVEVPDRLTWSDVRHAACTSADDHLIKLVHAMSVQNADAADPVWLDAATTAVVGARG